MINSQLIKTTVTAILLGIAFSSPASAKIVSAESDVQPATIVAKPASRPSPYLKTSEIKSRIEEICQAETTDQLSFEYSRLASNLILPGNLISWDLTSNSDNEVGMRVFALEAQTEAGPFRQLIQVNVSKTVEAAKLATLIKPGEVITEEMLIPVTITVKNDKNTPVAYKDLIGKTLDRFKSAGTIVRPSDLSNGLRAVKKQIAKAESNDSTAHTTTAMASASSKSIEEENWLIKPGENVEFRVNSGSLSLSIPAKAVQGGNNGDEIQLINLKNKRRISGIITEKGVVEYAQK